MSKYKVKIRPTEQAIILKMFLLIDTIYIENNCVIHENNMPGSSIWKGETVFLNPMPYIRGIIKGETTNANNVSNVKKLKLIREIRIKVSILLVFSLPDKLGNITDPIVTAIYSIIWLILAARE